MSRDETLAAGLDAWGVEAVAAPLAGDASTRRYVRSRRGGTSVVVMDCGMPLPELEDEEGDDPFPFTRWQRFYRELGIRVPDVLAIDRPRGLVLLEDLGDEMLQARVERVGPDACRESYFRAVSWGLRLAHEGTARFVPDAHVADDPLTPARLALEMDLFLVHAAAVPLAPSTAGEPPLRRAALALDGATGGALAAARTLLHELCVAVHGSPARPMVLCHRDYHARNLLVVEGQASAEDLAVIDFQDTRRGPRAYDLASLAWDPYVSLPQSLIEELVDRWQPEGTSPAAWQDEVALAAGQRLVKAAGSYAWLGHGCGRTEYLRWFEPALARAHERLAAWEGRDDLWKRLSECGALA